MAVPQPASADAVARQHWDRAFHHPVNDFLGRPGKRIRAELVELSFRIGGGQSSPPDNVLDFVELLHAGSLAIDDIQDNSRTRRGQSALHLKYGIPLAINTGNWMYFAALEALNRLDISDRQSRQVLQRTLSVIKRCHEGQALDLATRFDEIRQDEALVIATSITDLKTAALTSLAAWLGSVSARAAAPHCEVLALFGARLGVGLQMQNDFIELQKAAYCNAVSEDLINRRVNWPWAWLAEAYPRAEFDRLRKRATDHEVEMKSVAEELVSRIEIQAVNEINEQLEGAIAVLHPFKLERDVVERLNQLIAMLELQYV